MNLTAFPFADGEYTAKQIAEVARKGVAQAEKDIWDEMGKALDDMNKRLAEEHERDYKLCVGEV